MADIFISYSKADHTLALKLSAFLEAEGWSVWWDKSLAAADLYRDEIMRQLAAARAVITIWTENSVKSDWVRAEAGTAKKEGKLIPVKTADVAYADIPLPFGEMHTENIASTDLIRAAVVAQLAKPAVEPSAVALLTKVFKYELLTWWGIIGGAVVLFAAISTMLKLADWAQVLVEEWREWTHAFWVWAFSWLGIHLPPEWTPILSFLLFWSLLTTGQAVKSAIETQLITDKYQGKSFRLMSIPMAACLVLMLITGSLSLSYLNFLDWVSIKEPVFVMIGAVQLSIVPLIVIVAFARHRLHAAITVLLLLSFFTIIALGHPDLKLNYDNVFVGPDLEINVENFRGLVLVVVTIVIVTWISPLILLSVAPAKDVSRRLIFLAIGLILLIALNELSKLGLDVNAPKLRGNLQRPIP